MYLVKLVTLGLFSGDQEVSDLFHHQLAEKVYLGALVGPVMQDFLWC